MQVIVAYLSCGCVAWYASREYLPSDAADVCRRCGKPRSGVRATEVRVVEEAAP